MTQTIDSNTYSITDESSSPNNFDWLKTCGILCIKCNKYYVKKLNYDKHCSEKHPGSKRVFSCSICRQTFEYYEKFRNHCYRHVIRNRYSCKLCSKKFTNVCYLKSHVENFHGNALFCIICDKKYKTEHSLNRHIRENHYNYNEYECKICNKKLLSQSSYRLHLLSHNPDANFICDVCGSKFTQKANLKVHLNSHTDQNPFKCELCPKRLPNKTKYEEHLLVHSGTRKFVCNVCNKAYKTKRYLKHHQKSHESIKKYVCEVCQKSFMTPRKLSDHMSVHTGEKSYKCKHCEKSFSNLSNWLKHTSRVHAIEKNAIPATETTTPPPEKKSEESAIADIVSANQSSDTNRDNVPVTSSIIFLQRLPFIIIQLSRNKNGVVNTNTSFSDISKQSSDMTSSDANFQKSPVNDVQLQTLAASNADLDEEFKLTAEYIEEQIDAFDFVPDMPDINIPSLISTLDDDISYSNSET